MIFKVDFLTSSVLNLITQIDQTACHFSFLCSFFLAFLFLSVLHFPPSPGATSLVARTDTTERASLSFLSPFLSFPSAFFFFFFAFCFHMYALGCCVNFYCVPGIRSTYKDRKVELPSISSEAEQLKVLKISDLAIRDGTLPERGRTGGQSERFRRGDIPES